jgi:hypothetical protein
MESCRLSVHLKPRAKNERIMVGDDGRVSLSVHAPPVDGKANAACVEALAQRLKLARSALSVVAGWKSRDKVVEVNGLARDEALRRLVNSGSK